MTDAPLFSVIIPTYGRAELLRSALSSVLSQTVPDFEVLVVDDGGQGIGPAVVDRRCRVVSRQRRAEPLRPAMRASYDGRREER